MKTHRKISLKLNKKNISDLSFLKGGKKIESIHIQCPYGEPDDTLDYDCNSSFIISC